MLDSDELSFILASVVFTFSEYTTHLEMNMAKITKPGDYNIELLDAPVGTIKGAIKASGASEGQRVLNVPIDLVHVLPGLNPRTMGTPASNAHIDYLTKSILANGYDPESIMKGFVRKIDGVDTICLRDGHHRLIAVGKANAKIAGTVETVPVLLDETELTQAELTISFAKANSGLRHNPYELAVLAKRGLDAGMSKKEVATSLVVTTRYLDDLGVLFEAGEEIIDLVVTDKCSATLAVEEIKAHGVDKATKRLVKAYGEAQAAGKTKVTKKALTKKPKKAKEEPAADEAEDASGEPLELPVEAVAYDAVLVALETINAFAVSDTVDTDQRGLLDAIMSEVIRTGGSDDLVTYAVTTERYEATGLVRLGIVEVEGAEAESEAEAAAALEAATKPKRDRKKKAPAAEVTDVPEGDIAELNDAQKLDAAASAEDEAAGL